MSIFEIPRGEKIQLLTERYKLIGQESGAGSEKQRFDGIDVSVLYMVDNIHTGPAKCDTFKKNLVCILRVLVVTRHKDASVNIMNLFVTFLLLYLFVDCNKVN